MNPEFVRNLWLEAAPFRLALIAGVLLLVFAALSVSPFGQSGNAAAIAQLLYWFVTVLWGTRAAGLSVVGEIRERTWDSQKLSAIGPVEMVWGKLVGATIHTCSAVFFACRWCCGRCCGMQAWARRWRRARPCCCWPCSPRRWRCCPVWCWSAATPATGGWIHSSARSRASRPPTASIRCGVSTKSFHAATRSTGGGLIFDGQPLSSCIAGAVHRLGAGGLLAGDARRTAPGQRAVRLAGLAAVSFPVPGGLCLHAARQRQHGGAAGRGAAAYAGRPGADRLGLQHGVPGAEGSSSAALAGRAVAQWPACARPSWRWMPGC